MKNYRLFYVYCSEYFYLKIDTGRRIKANDNNEAMKKAEFEEQNTVFDKVYYDSNKKKIIIESKENANVIEFFIDENFFTKKVSQMAGDDIFVSEEEFFNHYLKYNSDYLLKKPISTFGSSSYGVEIIN